MSRPERYARNIPIYYLFQFATGFLIWVPVWIIFLQDERGLSLTQVGLMEAVFWACMMLFEVPTGAIADRFGRRTSLALGGFLFTGGTIFFVLSDGFAGLAISYVIMAISMTLYSGSGHALLYDSLRVLGRTREYEKHMGRSEALMTGALLGAALFGGPMAGLWGLETVFLIGAGTMAAAGFVALMLREPPRTEAEFGPDGLHAAPISAADAASDMHGSSGFVGYVFEGFRIVLRQRPILWIILLAGIVTVAYEMPSFFVQPFLRSHGLSPSGGLLDGAIWSGLIVPAFAAMSAGSLLAAPFVARVGERRAIPLLMFGGAFLFIPLLIFNHISIVAPIAILGGIHAAIRPIATGYINRRIRSDQRATVLSIFELMMAAQMAVIVPLISASADVIDFRFAYALSIGVVLTVGVVFLLYWRRSHRREQTDALRRISLRPAPQAVPHAIALTPDGTTIGVHPTGIPVPGNGVGSGPDYRNGTDATPERVPTRQDRS
ncbi:MAG: MFS transporter [Chloroflexi bacterium]|nr:MFS transporter [Chloroflexota bacterium]MCY3587214.1 MFS transporter [Chloroflexota bacterium]MCY3685921.1 MFS transporter [Chloroflexota bacterium]MDE2709689.1 MFS transporter [Chloroflexota bacterium]